ncbi:hypothetical protein OHT76_12455 [Streptomyces sp. NBC_00287]|uniref:hypothetical protein n=1 Tax=Streptomyces sp. NBC_00287 TaxID=2975702 RepID=UPI002E2B3A46|nr:hypothetical protein [Streptomyces sp. NBC_00287]
MTFGDQGIPYGQSGTPHGPHGGQETPYSKPGTPQGHSGAPYGDAGGLPGQPHAPYGEAGGFPGQPHAPYGEPGAFQVQPQPPYEQPGPAHYGYPAPPDPHAAWVAAEQERIRRRRGRRVAAGVTGGMLAVAVAAGALLLTSGGDGEDPAAASDSTPSTTSEPSASPTVPRVDVGMPSNAPSALPSLLARPIISPEQAFPQETVTLKDGSTYERVDWATTTDCAYGMSQELAELIEQGEPCARMTAALFTDADRRSQVTVSVLTFERVEDASRVFMMASMDPVAYQVVSLDPPPEAGLPTVPPGSSGVFQRLMTVRSVVFANGQWGDGSATREEEITRQTQGLLQHVNDTVVAYEDGDD